MGLVKRGRVWWMSFAHQGRQVRRSTGTSDRRLADAILAKIKTQLIEGRYFDTLEEKTRTLEELMARFEQEHVVKLASKRQHRGYIAHLKQFFGAVTLDQVTPKRIAAYKIKRYADGVKPSTINRELSALKKAFNLARREWEWCQDNPVSRIAMEKEDNRRDRWLSSEEEERLLKSAAPWSQELVVFALHTGMRLGEILGLTWQGVDLFRRTVTVFRSKNGERRTIPVNHTVLGLLADKAKVRCIRTDHVFHTKEQTPFQADNVRRAFRAALAKAEITDVHFHDLRHTFATRLVQAGVDLYKVQRLLGHKSPVMTQRYAHHFPESLRDGVLVLDQPKTTAQFQHNRQAAQTGGLVSA